MKQLLTILLSFISLHSFSQSFPIKQNLGSKTTQVHVPGLLVTDSGFVLKGYVDTTAANIAQLKFNGSLIKVDGSLFLYNVNKWIKISIDTLPLSYRINNNAAAIVTKQPILLSTINIKTINGSSMLGSGDLPIIDNTKIPLTGTEVFKPITGTLEIAGRSFGNNSGNLFGFVVPGTPGTDKYLMNGISFNGDYRNNEIGAFTRYSTNMSGSNSAKINNYATTSLGQSAKMEVSAFEGGEEAFSYMETSSGAFTTRFGLQVSTGAGVASTLGATLYDDAPTARGLRGLQDFTANIQPLDYVQKKYVDNLVTTNSTVLLNITKAQRDALVSPAQGKLVFVTDDGGYYSYFNNGWIENIPLVVSTKSANYTLTTADNYIDATVAGITFTMFSPVGNKKEVLFTNSTVGNIFISSTNGIGNFTITTNYTLATDKFLRLKSNGTSWKIINAN